MYMQPTNPVATRQTNSVLVSLMAVAEGGLSVTANVQFKGGTVLSARQPGAIFGSYATQDANVRLGTQDRTGTALPVWRFNKRARSAIARTR